MSRAYEHLDLGAIRRRLEQSHGRQYWRSLDELASTEGFQEFLHREFPRQAAEWHDAAGRRKFLQLMGASLALAGLSACARQPAESIVPYVRQPEEVIPGRPLFFATAVTLHGVASGVLVESHLGRPTKVEGNPDHPASLGAADAFAQASVLSLYDPDRSQTLMQLGEIRPWPAFLGAMREALAGQRAKQGAGLRFLTETVTSPTLASQIRGVLAELPRAKWHQYEPAGAHSARAGALLAFGAPVNTYYQIAKADVILALDADLLCSGPASVRYARDFAARRRAEANQTAMSRLYAVETAPTPSGAKADHRLPLRAGEMEAFTAVLAGAVGVAGMPAASGPHASWIAAAAKDLRGHRGACVVIAGEQQPARVHALAHAMNAVLGNVGKTVVHTDAVEADPADQIESLRELVADMEAGGVDLLVIAGGNPVYNAPADLRFRERMAQVKLRVHSGLYDDETSEMCQWHVPATHYLESWSDARAYDGTVTIQQPLIAPLYFGRSMHELFAAFTERPERASYEIVREYWKTQRPGADFESWWRKAVHDGLIAGSALPAKSVSLRQTEAPAAAASQGLEIVFRPDPAVHDGRYANNGWLQELPRPLSKITWDNVAQVSPATAQRLNVQNGDLVELSCQGRTIRAPVWISPGHADDSVSVTLGYGRMRAGRVASGVGFNAYALRTSQALWSAAGAEIRKTGGKHALATTQHHHSMEGRNLAVSGTAAEYRKNREFVQERAEAPPKELTLYPGFPSAGYAWGMTVDLSACVGCNACVVACQAENNIPVVGKEQVEGGREMHWLRIDTYFSGSLENPETLYQPVMCVQCENAPCELVCPVQATNHSHEGLNDMVYNRCVGTRYCANNCPYKVRRFNFLLYTDWASESLKLQRNPDVSVRSRGVMEKCTYCVQRINAAKIDAEKEDRTVRDGEIRTACEASCPAQAIVFGNINDKNSRVARLKAGELNYGLLAELNTRPRTTYLAALRNPNPELERGGA